MIPLTGDLRTLLEHAIVKAREVAEEAARAALTMLAVRHDEAFPSLTLEQQHLRKALRVRAWQLGHDDLKLLIEEIAYEQWHRRLFARFLAENHLLMHPSGTAVTLEECGALAAEEGETDGWQLAARYASIMLPGIFRINDPAVQIQFSPEGRQKLEEIVTHLPKALFLADDALGWVYQFWQTKKKAEINASGRKIGDGDIPPVTQIFTEHYMVQFLLDNSLGAWWAARHPNSSLVKQFSYLRFREDGTPAAGTFPGWPEHTSAITVMDPCCGSGHFLVAAFEMLCRMRMEEEGLSGTQAADAVLRDNLFGLELDARCTQIAAFALALAAWKMSGYRELPLPNIACSGIAVEGQLETWTQLAEDDVNLCRTLARQYNLFRTAPDLGSLIDPNNVPLKERMFASDYTQVGPLLKQALEREHVKGDPVSAVFGAAAEGMVKAARLLARKYTLVATNVPYLVSGKQDDTLKQFCEEHHPDAKADLATAFIERCQAFTISSCSYAVVTPQNWFFQYFYKNMRKRMLKEQTWNHMSRLGAGAFESISGEVVNVGLLILTNQPPPNDHIMTGIDASTAKSSYEKARLLCHSPLEVIKQFAQLQNPDTRITLTEHVPTTRLAQFASSYKGITTGDDLRFRRKFWEMPSLLPGWRYLQSSLNATKCFGGRESVLWFDELQSPTHQGAYIRAAHVWGKKGVLVSLMGQLPVTLYTGEAFDTNCSPIIPKNAAHLSAIWAFCQSPEFHATVRRIDQALKVADATLVKIPFDLAHWQQIANAAGELPKPSSNDPTQWLFKGHPVGSTHPLQVVVARLLGYRWPQQEADALAVCADHSGIVCLPSVAGAEPAVEQLRALLAKAYSETWIPALQERLLADVGYGGKSLEVWLRDGFFEQHCSLFHNRPFIWHIWDGRKDGFSALVNYHRLDAAGLDRLIYTYLGTWIATQRAEQHAGLAGAEARLVAALKLQEKLIAISNGEQPYDIYIRWKPLCEQPIGWNPDINDGVRLNIRPFVEAGVLRSRFTIHWNKDRGKNLDGSERRNALHTTLAEKHAARSAVVQ